METTPTKRNPLALLQNQNLTVPSAVSIHLTPYEGKQLKEKRAKEFGLTPPPLDAFLHNQSFPILHKDTENGNDMGEIHNCSIDKFKGDALGSISFSPLKTSRPDSSRHSNRSWLQCKSDECVSGSKSLHSYVQNPYKAICTIDFHTTEILTANVTALHLLGIENSGKIFKLSDFIVSPDNQYLFSEADLKSNGELVLFSGKVMDLVTKSKQVVPFSVWARKLCSEGDLRCIVVMEPVERVTGTVKFDFMGKISRCDKSFASLFGYLNPEEITGSNIRKLIPSLDCNFENKFIEKEYCKQSVTGRAVDGFNFPLSIDIKPVSSSNLEGYHQSDSKSADSFLYEGVVWVFNNISGLITLQPDGNIHSCNANFSLLLFGYTQSELQGKNIASLISSFYEDVDCLDTDSMALPPFDDDDDDSNAKPSDGRTTADSIGRPMNPLGRNIELFDDSEGILNPTFCSSFSDALSPLSEDCRLSADFRTSNPELDLADFTSKGNKRLSCSESQDTLNSSNNSSDVNANFNYSKTPEPPFSEKGSDEGDDASAFQPNDDPEEDGWEDIDEDEDIDEECEEVVEEECDEDIAEECEDVVEEIEEEECEDIVKEECEDTVKEECEDIVKEECEDIAKEEYEDINKECKNNDQSEGENIDQLECDDGDWENASTSDESEKANSLLQRRTIGQPGSKFSEINVSPIRDSNSRSSCRKAVTKGSSMKENSNVFSDISPIIPEGEFIGIGRHKDGTNLNIKYCIKKVTLEDGKVLFCLWVSRDPDELKMCSPLTRGRFSNCHSRSNQSLASEATSGTQSSNSSNSSMLSESEYVDGEFSEKFSILQHIRNGAFGCIKKAYRKSDCLLVIAKFIRKSEVYDDLWVYDNKLNKKVPLEVSLLYTVDHPNIVKVLDVFENNSCFQMVMEKHGCGMDLFEFIERNPEMDEPLCSYIFRQIVSALSYLHELSIIHRDVKDENVIINEKFHVKLIDFGSATFLSDEPFSTFCGTLEYCSPEVIRGNKYQGPELEMFALGVTLYTLIFGENPFVGADETLKGKYRIPFEISDGLKSLIAHLLEPNPSKRCTLFQAEVHPWVSQPVNIDHYKFSSVIQTSADELYPPKYHCISDAGNELDSSNETEFDISCLDKKLDHIDLSNPGCS